MGAGGEHEEHRGDGGSTDVNGEIHGCFSNPLVSASSCCVPCIPRILPFLPRAHDTIWIGVKITISKENYLKTIAEAETEGEPVIAATLARWLNVSAPALTMAVKPLQRDSLIPVGRDGQRSLTASRRHIANQVLH